MLKYSTILVILITVLPCLADGNSVSQKTLKNADKKFQVVYPFPPIWPVEQGEYEKTLSIPEREWLSKVKDHFEKCFQIEANKQNFNGVSCSLDVTQKGDIMPTVYYSVVLSKPMEKKMTKQLLSLSPFPSANSNHRIIVGFNAGVVTSLRFWK